MSIQTPFLFLPLSRVSFPTWPKKIGPAKGETDT
jgi:hypothetical protein